MDKSRNSDFGVLFGSRWSSEVGTCRMSSACSSEPCRVSGSAFSVPPRPSLLHLPCHLQLFLAIHFLEDASALRLGATCKQALQVLHSGYRLKLPIPWRWMHPHTQAAAGTAFEFADVATGQLSTDVAEELAWAQDRQPSHIGVPSAIHILRWIDSQQWRDLSLRMRKTRFERLVRLQPVQHEAATGQG